jgi:hypothetical protein
MLLFRYQKSRGVLWTGFNSYRASLAWPVAAVIIVILFKVPLSKRLASLLSLKLPGGVEAQFADELGKLELRAETVDVAAELARSDPANAGNAEHVLQDIDVPLVPSPADALALKANPTGVVMEAWKDVERSLRLAGQHAKSNVKFVAGISIVSIVKYLLANDFLTQQEADMVSKLKQMRDLAAHSQDRITPESADSFAEIAGRLAATLANRAAVRYGMS